MTPMLLEDDGDSMLTLLLTRLTRRHFLAKSAVFAPVQLCKSLYYLHLCSVQVSTYYLHRSALYNSLSSVH